MHKHPAVGTVKKAIDDATDMAFSACTTPILLQLHAC
jgi:hypothetical protein